MCKVLGSILLQPLLLLVLFVVVVVVVVVLVVVAVVIVVPVVAVFAVLVADFAFIESRIPLRPSGLTVDSTHRISSPH